MIKALQQNATCVASTLPELTWPLKIGRAPNSKQFPNHHFSALVLGSGCLTLDYVE